ncbi:hypothetical protein BC936DRAFT_144963 [Jimgerdemannia flammicorona]|uniref:Uncharacterized protein n=1 Tax=Jimgerdemannia flammicorona TaxID=994334 RepID=A0A433DB96_9FUNG|nr:hypothetical protein BC936DRAFT_144963 [Jimgerdemannia flammicorona]
MASLCRNNSSETLSEFREAFSFFLPVLYDGLAKGQALFLIRYEDLILRLRPVLTCLYSIGTLCKTDGGAEECCETRGHYRQAIIRKEKRKAKRILSLENGTHSCQFRIRIMTVVTTMWKLKVLGIWTKSPSGFGPSSLAAM